MNIINEFWDHIENKKTKQAEKIYNWLNYDNLSNIIVDDEVFWFELTRSDTILPNYIYDYMVKWGEKRGLRYLYKI